MPIVVSESKAEETLQAYAHPLSIQAKAISDLEERLLDGDIVADGNNVFTFLTEFSSNMTAGLVQKACACFNSLYPENAQTATDLYKHLSDFDYIGLFATPAEMTVELVFDRNFLIDNSIYDSTLKCYKIIVPEYSKFTVGSYVFGLMYPIEIRIRKAPTLPSGLPDYDNSVITVMWDTSTQNPLKTLETHILEHRDFVQEGQTLTAIEVPIYQFEVENHVENAIASTGFAKRYDYLNKFYAVRIFHFKGGKWNEMAQTLSDINYDVDKPTAMVKVLADIGKVEIVIPQIYFNTEKESAAIGNRILVKIYTTQGELNLDLSGYDINQYTASFLMTDTILVEDDTYSNMLKRIPTIYILPATSRIASGTDGITMDELKERVKHDASYTVKITPDDLDAYFATSGFTFTKELDNITDRVYCAHKVITDGTGTTIAAGEEKTYLTPEVLNIQENSETGELYVPNYSNVAVLDTNNVTIGPNAIYRYDSDKNYFVMLNDEEMTAIENKTVEDRINTLNNGLYTYNPFHIRISLDPSLPIASSYDMTDPTLKSIVFKWENPNTTAEISVYTANVTVLNTEDDGYRLSVALFRTANLADVKAKEQDGIDINNIHVMLSTTNSEGVYLYMLGQYDGQDESGHDVFIFDIKSKFKITSTGMFDVLNMYDESGNDGNNFLDADTHAYQLSFFIKEEFITDSTYPMDGVSLTGVPGILDGYVYLCQQEFKMKFGSALPLLKNNLAIGVSDATYATYPTTQFDTYNAPIYARWSIQDVKLGTYDPVTCTAVTAAKVGMLKVDVTADYFETTDTTYVAGKLYLKKEGTGSDVKYVKVDYTPGEEIKETLYERKNVKYVPVVKHAQGDVIISSPYGFDYGPVTTMIIDDEINSLQLVKPYTVTSDVNNVWLTVEGDIFVMGSTTGSFNGLYTETTKNETDIKKKRWVHTSYATSELYDCTTMDVGKGAAKIISLYKQTINGITTYYVTKPQGTYTEIKFNIAGSYLSSNSDTVKSDSYVASNANDNVNTRARGEHRKWYLVDGTTYEGNDPDFNFNTYTGFLIEYNTKDVSNLGLEYSWTLSYYYRTKDESGLTCSGVCIIDEDMTTATDLLSTNDIAKLSRDAYVAQYDSIVHLIHFVTNSTSAFTGWMMGITNDTTSLTALDYKFKAAVTDAYVLASGEFQSGINYYQKSGDTFVIHAFTEEGTALEANTYYELDELGNYTLTTDTTVTKGKVYYKYDKTSKSYVVSIITVGATIPTGTFYTLKILMPYEAEWVNINKSDKSVLSVTSINNTSNEYKVSVTDALAYIKDYLNDDANKIVVDGVTVKLYEAKAYQLNKYIDEAKLTTDTYFKDDTDYYTQSDTTSTIRPHSYTKAIAGTDYVIGATIPANTYYNKCSEYLVDPLAKFIFTCVETCDDSKTQEECNAEINYNAGVKDTKYTDRELEVGTAGALGAIYYKDTDYVNFDYAKYSLTVDTIISVIEAWERYKAYSEDMRYKYVVAETGVALSLVKQLVSVSKPCYVNPWRKLITVSSYSALLKYYNERHIVNCPVSTLVELQDKIKAGYTVYNKLIDLKHALDTTPVTAETLYYVNDITGIDETELSGEEYVYTEEAKELREWLELDDDKSLADFANRSLLGTVVSPVGAYLVCKTKSVETVVRCGYDEATCKSYILAFSVYSGYLYIVSKKVNNEYKDAYINYTSKLDRTYQGEESTYTRNEFNVNFETTLWSEVDKWPWEVDTPWISVNVTESEIVDLTFAYNTDMGCAKVLHANTDVLVDEDGEPIIATDGSRSESFMIDMLHCDYKLMLSNDSDYINYITDIRELLRSYFNELNTISPSLLARTKIYFAPIRTFGTSQFKGNGGTEITLPLEFSIGLGLHVESYVNGSDLNKDTIKNSILTLVDARLKEGYLNLSLLARDIMNDLSDNIICVDVLGINGDNSLQTMIPVNDDCFPQLKQVLVMNDDGSVHTTRSLDITWYVID